MGCDIHGVVEQCVDGKWITINTLTGCKHYDWKTKKSKTAWPLVLDRYYPLFAALAGVRGEGPEPKGFPEDASETAQHLYKLWGRDAHSASWISLRDFMIVWEAVGEPKEINNLFYLNHDDMVDTCRFVFWFDN